MDAFFGDVRSHKKATGPMLLLHASFLLHISRMLTLNSFIYSEPRIVLIFYYYTEYLATTHYIPRSYWYLEKRLYERI